VASFLPETGVIEITGKNVKFSSLSESGFIPTNFIGDLLVLGLRQVLISFREWLHSYVRSFLLRGNKGIPRSHLFQRVASFLLLLDKSILV